MLPDMRFQICPSTLGAGPREFRLPAEPLIFGLVKKRPIRLQILHSFEIIFSRALIHFGQSCLLSAILLFISRLHASRTVDAYALRSVSAAYRLRSRHQSKSWDPRPKGAPISFADGSRSRAEPAYLLLEFQLPSTILHQTIVPDQPRFMVMNRHQQ